MCRLAAFPPGFSRSEATRILQDFEGCNTDGTGYGYVVNGNFIIRKSPRSLSAVLKSDKNFLAHMDEGNFGWTIAHVRAATHGDKHYHNSHPFPTTKYLVAHNGIWGNYHIAKLLLDNIIILKGFTDSEVAAHTINIIGPEKFAREVDWAGVFLCLKTDGSLHVIKVSGQLAFHQLTTKQMLVASEFPKDYKTTESMLGYYLFNKEGNFVKHIANKFPKYDFSDDKPLKKPTNKPAARTIIDGESGQLRQLPPIGLSLVDRYLARYGGYV